VHPAASGLGLGPQLVRHAWAHAAQAGWRQSTLVSVQASVGFWERQGYAAMQPADPAQQARLATYPGTSVYMARRLANEDQRRQPRIASHCTVPQTATSAA
jgi:ribosomal protein S18 acetylase RimI-like enzyme